MDFNPKTADQKLTTFLYILMRDYLPAGTVEKIMSEHVDLITDTNEAQFSNSHLQKIAEDVAHRMKPMGIDLENETKMKEALHILEAGLEIIETTTSPNEYGHHPKDGAYLAYEMSKKLGNKIFSHHHGLLRDVLLTQLSPRKIDWNALHKDLQPHLSFRQKIISRNTPINQMVLRG